MKRLKTSILIIGTFIFVGCNQQKKDDAKTIHIDNIVDLTHNLTADFPFIPVKKLTYPFKLIPMATLKDNGVEANSWKIHEYLGTHQMHLIILSPIKNHLIK